MEARQRVKLSLTNRSIGLISCERVPRSSKPAENDRAPKTADKHPSDASQPRKSSPDTTVSADSPPGGWSTWWSQRGARTRSHPELGRENPPRQWYCVSRRGRVGRRQVHQPPGQGSRPTPANPSLVLSACRSRHPDAGWSSPVARQAHNLKVAGSNPAPATNKQPAFERAFLLPRSWSGFESGGRLRLLCCPAPQ